MCVGGDSPLMCFLIWGGYPPVIFFFLFLVMEATAERKIFDEVLEILRVLGNDIKVALYCGGLRADSLESMKGLARRLNEMDVSDFIGSWLKIPSNRGILEVYVSEIMQTYCYHREVETANFRPEQLGEEYTQIADAYDRWRNTIILKLSDCLPDGAASMEDYKKYVMFPKSEDKLINKTAKGIKDVSFKDCLLVDDKDELLKLLHNLIDGKKGKFVAKVIKVCCDNGLMEKPTFTQVMDEFGDIGNKSGYNKYVAYRFDSDEKKPIVEALKEFFNSL